MRRATVPGRGRRDLRLAALGATALAFGLVALALWSAAARAEAEAAARGRRGADFSLHIDDLPIMPGLSEDDRGFAIDLDEGRRLVEARLSGQADPAVVRGFYAAALAQLGWRHADDEPYVYRRGGERLIFLVEPVRGRPRGLEAVFVVSPDDLRP